MFKSDSCSALNVLAEEYDLFDAAYIMVEKFITLRPEEQEVIMMRQFRQVCLICIGNLFFGGF